MPPESNLDNFGTRPAHTQRHLLPRVGTNEPPSVALLRYLLYPLTAAIGLFLITAVFEQPFTRPYLIVAILAFALSWRLLGAADCNELRAPSQIDYFFPRLVLGWAKVVGILLFIGFIAKTSAAYSRAVILTWAAVTPLLFLAAHALAYRMLCRWNRHGRISRTHIIVGDNRVARDFAARLEQDPSLGTLIGFFDTGADRNESEEYLGALRDLPQYVRRNSIDVIHIAVRPDAHPELRRVLHALRDTTASIYFLLDLPTDRHSQARIVEMAGTPMLAYFETPYCGLAGVAKRILDFSIACALLAVLWPLLLLIAACVRWDSPGPVIFKQRRYGLNGEEIAVYKFRTMTVCEDGPEVAQARRQDPRVTRIGRFLRRTSLDELPQLFCVVAGSMSLVGPRPHAIAHNEQYRRVIDGYMLRHKVQPGMTGWAQINGFRGATDTLEQMRMRVAYDLEYLRHWSPWVDLKILWRTALLVIRDRNAF